MTFNQINVSDPCPSTKSDYVPSRKKTWWGTRFETKESSTNQWIPASTAHLVCFRHICQLRLILKKPHMCRSRSHITQFEVDDVENNVEIQFKKRFSDTSTPGLNFPLNVVLNLKTETTDLSNTLTSVCLCPAKIKLRKLILMNISVNESKSETLTEEAAFLQR